MKKYLFFVPVVVYLAISLVVLDLNLVHWEQVARLMLVMFTGLILMAIYGNIQQDQDQKNYEIAEWGDRIDILNDKIDKLLLKEA